MESSKVFYGMLNQVELESNLYVAKKQRGKRDKLWSVCCRGRLYMFKKRMPTTNAMFEIDLNNKLRHVQLIDEGHDSLGATVSQGISLHYSISTLVLTFYGEKKSLFLTPLDNFDFNRWHQMLQHIASDCARSTDTNHHLVRPRLAKISISYTDLPSIDLSAPHSPHDDVNAAQQTTLNVNTKNNAHLYPFQSPIALKKAELLTVPNRHKVAKNGRKLNASCSELDK